MPRFLSLAEAVEDCCPGRTYRNPEADRERARRAARPACAHRPCAWDGGM